MIVRRFISAVLLLALLVAGQSLAVARGQAAGVMEMVLCTGFGTQVITVDAEGNKVSPAHLCPDGVAAMVEAHVPPPELALSEGRARDLAVVERGVSTAYAMRSVFEARGPPLV